MNAPAHDAVRGWRWIAEGFALFLKSPVMWIALTVIMALMWIVSFLIPVLGPLLFNLLSPVLFAGLMLGCKALERGEQLELRHLFAGFQNHAAPLVTIGGVYLIGSIVVLGVVWATAGGPMLQTALQKGAGDMHAASDAARSMAPSLLAGLVLHLPLLMMIWFAPILVAIRGMKPVEAMKRSLAACLVNWLAFLVYGAILLVLLFLASIPLLLGLVVLLPVLFCSIYASYKDIFEPPGSDAPPEDPPPLR
jgi:uncharacterized membrane protein